MSRYYGHTEEHDFAYDFDACGIPGYFVTADKNFDTRKFMADEGCHVSRGRILEMLTELNDKGANVPEDHLTAMQGEDPVSSRWVVCGDFNTSEKNELVPSERTFPLMLKAGFFWTFEGVPFERRVTCPAKGRYPDACFDHIFVKGLGRPVASPLVKIGGSDHLPVAVDLDLRGR